MKLLGLLDPLGNHQKTVGNRSDLDPFENGRAEPETHHNFADRQDPEKTLQISGQSNQMLDCPPLILWGFGAVWCNFGAIMIGSGPVSPSTARGVAAPETYTYTPSDFSTKLFGTISLFPFPCSFPLVLRHGPYHSPLPSPVVFLSNRWQNGQLSWANSQRFPRHNPISCNSRLLWSLNCVSALSLALCSL